MFGRGKRLTTTLKNPQFQIEMAQGLGQDQYEYWSGKTLQTGQPTLGSTAGMAISILFRKLVGWTDTGRGVNVMNFMQAKGMSKADANAIIAGRYKEISPPAWQILSNELQLIPTEIIEIKSDIAECASTLAEISDSNRRAQGFGHRNNE